MIRCENNESGKGERERRRGEAGREDLAEKSKEKPRAESAEGDDGLRMMYGGGALNGERKIKDERWRRRGGRQGHASNGKRSRKEREKNTQMKGR